MRSRVRIFAAHPLLPPPLHHSFLPGAALQALTFPLNTGRLGNALAWFLGIQPYELFFYVFLPPLLADAGVRIDWFLFRRQVVQILTAAFLVVGGTTGLMIPLLLYGLRLVDRGWNWSHVALLGSMLASTDAVAILDVMKGGGGPRRLRVLLEGESLLNDASSFTLFTIFLARVLDDTAGPQSGAGVAGLVIANMLKLAVGGAAIGLAVSAAAHAVLRWMRRRGAGVDHQVALTLAGGYLSFYGANSVALSGVVAVAVFGLYGAATSTWDLPPTPGAAAAFAAFWDALSFVANATVFFFTGAAIVNFFVRSARDFRREELAGLPLANAAAAAFANKDLWAGLWRFPFVYIIVFGLRFLLLVGFRPLFILEGSDLPVREAAFATVAGLRGSVALILAQAVITSDFTATPAQAKVRAEIVLWTALFVLCTLLINAPTLPWWLRVLKLDTVPEARLALRRRAVGALRVHTAKVVNSLRQDGEDAFAGVDWGRVRDFVDVAGPAFDDFAGVTAAKKGGVAVAAAAVAGGAKGGRWRRWWWARAGRGALPTPSPPLPPPARPMPRAGRSMATLFLSEAGEAGDVVAGPGRRKPSVTSHQGRHFGRSIRFDDEGEAGGGGGGGGGRVVPPAPPPPPLSLPEPDAAAAAAAAVASQPPAPLPPPALGGGGGRDAGDGDLDALEAGTRLGGSGSSGGGGGASGARVPRPAPDSGAESDADSAPHPRWEEVNELSIDGVPFLPRLKSVAARLGAGPNSRLAGVRPGGAPPSRSPSPGPQPVAAASVGDGGGAAPDVEAPEAPPGPPLAPVADQQVAAAAVGGGSRRPPLPAAFGVAAAGVAAASAPPPRPPAGAAGAMPQRPSPALAPPPPAPLFVMTAGGPLPPPPRLSQPPPPVDLASSAREAGLARISLSRVSVGARMPGGVAGPVLPAAAAPPAVPPTRRRFFARRTDSTDESTVLRQDMLGPAAVLVSPGGPRPAPIPIDTHWRPRAPTVTAATVATAAATMAAVSSPTTSLRATSAQNPPSRYRSVFEAFNIERPDSGGGGGGSEDGNRLAASTSAVGGGGGGSLRGGAAAGVALASLPTAGGTWTAGMTRSLSPLVARARAAGAVAALGVSIYIELGGGGERACALCVCRVGAHAHAQAHTRDGPSNSSSICYHLVCTALRAGSAFGARVVADPNPIPPPASARTHPCVAAPRPAPPFLPFLSPLTPPLPSSPPPRHHHTRPPPRRASPPARPRWALTTTKPAPRAALTAHPARGAPSPKRLGWSSRPPSSAWPLHAAPRRVPRWRSSASAWPTP